MIRKVVNGCPYCGSKEGFEQKETVTRFLFYDSKGNPDGGNDGFMVEDQSWKYPKCCSCGKRVIIDDK